MTGVMRFFEGLCIIWKWIGNGLIAREEGHILLIT